MKRNDPVPGKCTICKNKKKQNRRKWVDYSTGKTHMVCSACYATAKNKRAQGYAFSTALKKGMKPIRIKLLRKKTVSIYEQKLRKQLKLDVGECQWCKNKKGLSVHHYQPKSEGGRDEETNYLVLCRTCHEAYHDKEEE